MKTFDIATNILNQVLKTPNQPSIVNNHQSIHCPKCLKPHLTQINQLITQQSKLTFILPAFPAKSANRQKTLSHLPDLGDELSLINLNKLCASIQTVYPFDVELIICSDGRVFNDLVLVDDSEVDQYQAGIKAIIEKNDLHFLSVFSLEDALIKQDYPLMRQQLMTDYGESLIALKARVKQDKYSQYQFNGIHRFITEDQYALKPFQSRNRTRLEAKKMAYEVVRRSNAWSSLLAAYFPEAIRLSIHPQLCGSEKIGIQCLPAVSRWATPWHNVLLKNKQGWQLIKRSEAERLGAKLNDDHYVLEAC